MFLLLLAFDQVKSCHLPALPQQRELVSELRPIHARLSFESSIARRHPVYRCSEVQVFKDCCYCIPSDFDRVSFC